MSQVQWIKIVTSIWDNPKIKLIEKMPERDAIMVIWFKLITFAGQTNTDGKLQLTEFLPLDAEMMADIFNRPVEVVKKALEVFERFGMIEIDDLEFYSLKNWAKYQNVDALEKRREADRLRVQRYREKQKQNGNVTGNATRNAGVTHKEKKREEKKEDKKKSKDSGPAEPDVIPYAEIIEHLNKTCGTAFKVTSEETKRLIQARWNNGFRLDDFKTVIDKKFAGWGNPQAHEKDMRLYLRPKTLFGTAFESYLNEPWPKKPQSGGRGGKADAGEGKPANGGDNKHTGGFDQFVIE